MFKNAFVLSKFRDKCGEKYKTGKGNTFYFMNGKLDFSRHNFLLHLCLKCTPSLQQLKSITVLIFLPLWMYAWRHTYKNMQKKKKNRKEEKIDHRKFCLCSVCNSFPHSIPLLILDFKVVVFFFKILSSIPLLYSLLLLKVFRHLSPNAQLHTVAPGNKCSVRGIKITWSLCGYHSSISCLFYSSACRMYCGVCLIFNNNLTILIKMLVQISITEHLVILNANQIR